MISMYTGRKNIHPFTFSYSDPVRTIKRSFLIVNFPMNYFTFKYKNSLAFFNILVCKYSIAVNATLFGNNLTDHKLFITDFHLKLLEARINREVGEYCFWTIDDNNT